MKLAPSEISKGALSAKHLKTALRNLKEVGYVVLESVLPEEFVASLNEGFDAVFEKQQDSFKEALAQVKGHKGVGISFEQPFMDPTVIANPLALQIITLAMGPDSFSFLPYHSNTAWPGSGLQHIHRDAVHLFPDATNVLPPALIVINIPLIDFTIENGATEVWPGTHRIVDSEPSVDGHACSEERGAQMPSLQTVMPAGSIVVRDMRMWHRGMPNGSTQRRSMVALVVYHALHNQARLERDTPIPKSIWESLSERGRHLYRFQPFEA